MASNTTAGRSQIYQKGEATPFTPLVHRDSEFSVSSDYNDGDTDHTTLLNFWQGATLLTADCLGTGLLALPDDIRTLGSAVGFGFLLLNLPINYYAGYIFHQTATAVEERQALENRVYRQSLENINEDENYEPLVVANDKPLGSIDTSVVNNVHHDTATFDFIGMSSAIFHEKGLTRWVMCVFYTNIFLVLGNYILVMSHAVSATLGEDNICIPTAGLIASSAMFAVSQLRTMAMLGRTATFVSLGALAIVVAQCLWEVHERGHTEIIPARVEPTVLRKFSALGGVGFATGSQKLFLNIRHELRDRSEAPKTLFLGLAIFGTVYVGMCWLAGPNAPPFLLDAIPQYTWNRRVAGFFLWVHVVVSYAINSQALCGSLDRLVWRRLSLPSSWPAPRRWLLLTGVVSIAAYVVSNAIPFFADLVSFIGAATLVPLTLLFPAMFFRGHQGLPLWGCRGFYSSALTYFALAFAIAATIGSLDSILMDWSTHGEPFSCR